VTTTRTSTQRPADDRGAATPAGSQRSLLDQALRKLREFAELSPAATVPPRISFAEWESLLPAEGSAAGELAVPDAELRRLGDLFRAALHPDGVVTYVVDRNINYSNVCTSICNFCAFYRSPGEEGGYVLSHDEIFRKVEETIELGGSGILMQGGLHPDLPLEWYTSLLRALKTRYRIHLHCFSPTEILGLSEVTGLSARDVLQALKDAGLDSMPAGAARSSSTRSGASAARRWTPANGSRSWRQRTSSRSRRRPR